MTDHPSLGAVARAIEDALNLKLTPKGRETVARAAIAAMPSVEAQAVRIAELEAAIDGAVLQIEYLHQKFGETGTGNSVLARLRAALGEKP